MVEVDLVKKINGDVRRYGWTAASYPQFWGRKARDGLTLRTGTYDLEHKVSKGGRWFSLFNLSSKRSGKWLCYALYRLANGERYATVFYIRTTHSVNIIR